MANLFNLENPGRSPSKSKDSCTDYLDSVIPGVKISESQITRPSSSSQQTGTLLDGILQNLSISNNTLQDHSCACDDGLIASSYCFFCKDYLCDRCVSAHNRVKLTRGHPIENVSKISNAPPSDIPKNSTSPQTGLWSYCNEHAGGLLQLYCEVCCVVLCDKCAVLGHNGHHITYMREVPDKSKAEIFSLISQSRAKVAVLENVSQEILKMIKSLDVQASSICLEIRTTFSKLSSLLEQREQELIDNVQKIRQMKLHALNSQFEEVCQRSHALFKLTSEVHENVKFNNNLDYVKAKNSIIEELSVTDEHLRKNATPSEDPVIFFRPPDPAIRITFQNLGKVSSDASAQFSAISVQHSNTAICNQEICLSILTNNHLKEPCDVNNSSMNIGVRDPQGNLVRHQITNKQNGSIALLFCPLEQGTHEVSVTIKGKNIVDSPHSVFVRSSESHFNNRSVPRLVFGETGGNDGQLCRPWGIACDQDGNFVVADRSNNRIQVFSSRGIFMYKFGKQGSYPGQFSRPAGITVDVNNRIIVADKDNHRIQAFSHDGEFLFAFGERGARNGQFYYPWDVATNSRGMIAVTDTRNHRIQIFDGGGKFIGKYGFDGLLWKHFDSPRGICFANNDQSIVVTDFNNHRLVIVQADLKSARFLGSEGAQPSQFLRPQGVVVDEHGNYVVADSRNNRLQIFSPGGAVIAILSGLFDGDPNEMDRPSGLTITRDSGIAVVDFGHDRIIVY